jgi:hypothetical protein
MFVPSRVFGQSQGISVSDILCLFLETLMTFSHLFLETLMAAIAAITRHLCHLSTSIVVSIFRDVDGGDSINRTASTLLTVAHSALEYSLNF